MKYYVHAKVVNDQGLLFLDQMIFNQISVNLTVALKIDHPEATPVRNLPIRITARKIVLLPVI